MATLKNTTINSTGHITITNGTTGQRPGSPTNGAIRWNSTLGIVESYRNSEWTANLPSATSLSFHIDAGNASSYGGSGTTVTDLNGAMNHNLQSADMYQTFDGVPCFDMRASGRTITPVTANIQMSTTGWTYVAWAALTPDNSQWRTLWRTTPDDHPILVRSGGRELGMYDNSRDGFVSTGYDVTKHESQWALWTTTGDASTGQKFYINDALVGLVYNNSVSSTPTANYHNQIGSAGGSQPFGWVGQARLYQRVWTQQEVRQFFHATRKTYGI